MQNQLMEGEEEKEEEDERVRRIMKKKKLQQTTLHSSRIPLREFNRIKNPSPSTSVSVDAPSACPRILLSSSNSTRFHLQKNPKSLTNKPLLTPKSAPVSSRVRSNNKPSKTQGNCFPKKHSSQTSKKNPSFLSRCHSGKLPASTPQRSKLSSDSSTNLKKNAARFGVLVNQQGLKQKPVKTRCLVSEPPADFNLNVADNLISIDNFTPVAKLACGSSLDYAIVDDNDKAVGEGSNSGHSSTVKTPPVEASVSPEIQCGGGSSNLVLASAATPVCYGAGHLLSGVTDKRKCRPKGILTVGGLTDSSDYGKTGSNENADVLFTKSRTSLIPLPVEASMRWLLSPPSKDNAVLEDDTSNSDTPFMDSASMCVSSSPSSYCRFASDLVCDSGDKNVSGNPDATTSTGKTRIVLLSPRRIANLQGLSDTPCEKYGDLLATPKTKSNCKTDNRQKGGDISSGVIGENTPFSVDPLSSSNVIQTPTSDSSPHRNVGLSWIDADDCQKNEFDPELGQVAEIFHRISVSPRSHVQMWDPPGLISQFSDSTSSSRSIDHIQLQLQKNLDNCASWISDTTVGNVSLSQMRISWREGLVSRTFGTDELDCCRCLSDEENYGDRSDKFQHKSPKALGMEERDSFRNGDLRFPEFLEQEPEITRKRKETLSHVGTNVCAESISMDAGGLVASEDSDWTLSYKNQLFEV